jgi:hypothetical protein
VFHPLTVDQFCVRGKEKKQCEFFASSVDLLFSFSLGWNGGVMMMARVDEFTSYHRRLWAREPVRVCVTHSVDLATNYPQKFQEYKPPFFYQN